MKTEIAVTKLPNGITVISDTAKHFQTAAICLKFAVGSAHEPEELCGISHLLEHLIFRGSERLGESAFQKAVGAIGADVNGRTDEDTTTYTATALKEDLENILQIFAEPLCNPRLSSEDIALEKQIIEQENCRGCPNCTMRDSLYAVAYPDQNLRHPIVGYEDTLEAITRDDLVAVHRSQYVTGNLTVSVAGDVSHAQVVSIVENAFADLPVGPRSRQPSYDFSPGEIVTSSGGDRAAINLHFDVTSRDLQGIRELTLFADALGGHGYSKLMEELREKRGLVYSSWANWSGVGKNRFLSIAAWCEARKTREVVELVGATIKDLANNFDEQELMEAKRRCRMYILRMLDDPAHRAERNAGNAVYDELDETPTALFEAYSKISRHDVMDAGEFLLSQSPAIFLGGSQRAMPSFEHIRASLRR